MSDAAVCSVDMDEMSLVDDDWDAVALLFTAESAGGDRGFTQRQNTAFVRRRVACHGLLHPEVCGFGLQKDYCSQTRAKHVDKNVS